MPFGFPALRRRFAGGKDSLRSVFRLFRKTSTPLRRRHRGRARSPNKFFTYYDLRITAQKGVCKNMLLPRGKLIKDEFNPVRMNWLEAIHKLQAGRFSGYLRCWDLHGWGVVLFVGGQLVAVRFISQHEQLTDEEAFARIFARSLSGDTMLCIYRLSKELALHLYGVVCGEVLFAAQQLQLLDIPHLLHTLKHDRFNGCLRVTAAEDVVLIFYEQGSPIGFFHDGGTDLAKDAELSESVAWQPGASVDIIAGQSELAENLPDLMNALDLPGCWQQAVARVAQDR